MTRWSLRGLFARVLPLLALCLASTSLVSAQQLGVQPPASSDVYYVVSLQPGPEGKDAGAYGIQPSTNFGAGEWYYAIGLPSYGMAYVKFDLSWLPADAVLDQAQLYLWAEYRDGTLTMEPVATDWDETTLNWSNRPAVVSPAIAVTYPISRGAPDGPCYWGCTGAFNVSDIVRAWMTGQVPNHGFRILGNTGSIGWMMASGDNLSHFRPMLWIQYDSNVPTTRSTWGKLKTLYR